LESHLADWVEDGAAMVPHGANLVRDDTETADEM